LQLLLTAIREGWVDVVVVYNRLTRSLADFVKIVEIFDAKGVSFVSVTQPVQHRYINGQTDPECAVVLCPV
jgi:DNA invertase Pin-like site-specific DNA recombinase